MGYVVGMGGWLRKEKEEEKSSEETEGKKTNGNGNGSNGNGNGNGGSNGGSNGGGVSEAWSAKYKKSIDCDNPKGFSQRAHCRGRKMNEAKGGDHEVAMAQSQLKKSAENIAKLRKALGKKEKDLPAWMQAKITDTAHDTDAAAGYMDEGTLQQKAERYAETLVNKARGTAAAYDAAKKKAENVKTTSGSVTIPEEVITEKRDGKSAKDKGYSLRDWFKGGGWVQAGGKYDGKPCAKQKGQKTKPYCRDADDRAAMSKEERNKRARKKRKEDPNANRKGKARNVRQESFSNWRQDLQEKPGDGYLGPTPIPNPIRLAQDAVDATNRANAKKVERINKILPGSASMPKHTYFNKGPSAASQRYLGLQNSFEPEGEMLEQATYRQRRGIDMTVPSDVYQGNPDLRASLGRRGSQLSRRERGYFKSAGGYARMQQDNQTMQQVIDRGRKNQERLSSKMVNTANWTDNQGRKVYAGNPPMRFDVKNSFEPEGDTVSEGDYRYGSYSTGRQKMLDGSLKTPADIDAYIKSKKSGKKPPVQTDKAHYEPEGELVDEGKKDACYHKVKSRYSVWPSAYASGALVKCRKVGAKNWGNKTKKEGYEYSNWKDDFVGTEYESVDIIKPEPLQPTEGIGSQMLDEAPMVEPSTSAAVPAKRPSMMQQVQSLRAMRMRSMQRQGLPLEAEKIRSKLSTSEVNASNERARELDKIRRQSRDATIASSRTQQPAPPARGPIARTPMQQTTAPVTKTQPTSNTSTITPPAVNQQQRDAAAELSKTPEGRETLTRYNMDPKVVRPQPEVKPQPEPKVQPTSQPTSQPQNSGANTEPKPIRLKVEPYQGNQSSSQQRVQQVASTTEKSFNDKLFGSMGYTKNPLGNSYLSPQQIRQMERDIRMNKNYSAGGLRQYYNPVTKKLELPEEVQLDEKCWKGYEKKGMKTMFGKRYPNCVKKKKTRKEEVELTEAPYKRPADGAGRATSTPPAGVPHADDSYVFPGGDVVKPGTMIDGSRNAAQAEREKAAKKRRQQVRMDTLNRIIKDHPKNWDFSNENVERRMMTGESSNWRAELAIQEDWQKTNRKDKTDGMSQKAVDAYKRENPGSKLKTAVTGNPKKGSKDAKRRKSFCSRSNGQRKMHNIDCSKTPDKKICKARRRWKC
jgi:hypothetical protein